MEENGKKKPNIVLISCIAAGICLAGIAMVVVLAVRKNPLTKGLMELSEELTALEAEMGEHFWTDMINQIGSENMQAEYSLNIGGVPELKKITVGIDGKSERNVEQELFKSEVYISVLNAEIAEASVFGTEDTLSLQVPSIWDGSIVFDAEDVSGQWNSSVLKKELQSLSGQKLEIDRRIDVDCFRSFSVESFSISDFLQENSDVLASLHKNMTVTEIDKAEKEGMLRESEVKDLEEVALENGDGDAIATTCYLVILPEQEFGALWGDIQGDIRLAFYLDSKKRIVRVSTLPEETIVADSWEGELAVNLTGTESVTDRMEFEITGEDDEREITETIILEKENDKTGAYQVKWNGSLTAGEKTWDFSLKGSVLGERIGEGGQDAAGGRQSGGEQDAVEGRRSTDELDDVGKQHGTMAKISIDVDNFVIKSGEKVICRGSGSVSFAPLTGEIQTPEGKEYRIAEMNELETGLFLIDCTKNLKENYSGYMKLMR